MSWQRQEFVAVLMLLVVFGLPLLILMRWPGDHNFWLRLALDEPIFFLPVIVALRSSRR